MVHNGIAGGAASGPLSYGQQALWFLDRLAPGAPAYVVAGAALVPGTPDVPALRRALETLLRRHPALSTRFRDGDDGPVQEVVPDGGFELLSEDFAGDRGALQERLGQIAYRPFDLAAGPLLRAAALSCEGQGIWTLLLATHHIAADFWSVGILLRELGALLAGRALPPAPDQRHLDWVCGQDAWLAGPEAERQWDFWQDLLADVPLTLELPTDRPRPTAPGTAGAALPLRLSADLTQGILRLAGQLAASPFLVLLGLFQALLGRLSGRERLLVGVPTFGRGGFARGPDEGLAGVVGYFVNPLPLPADLSGDPTVAGMLGRLWETTLEALAHDGLPFALLAESLQPERDSSRPPVVQVMFSFQAGRTPAEEALAAFTVGASDVPLELGGLAATTLALPVAGSQFDLSLALAKWDGALVGRWIFDPRLFDAATLVRWSGHFRNLLEAAVAAPQTRLRDLPLLSPAERHQLLVEWGRSPEAAPDCETLHGLVALQAARMPDASAVVTEDGVLSYGELARQAGRWARRLRALGVVPEARVAVCAERSPQLVAALLGVLGAGGAYLPLDPSYPRERLATMAADAGTCLLLLQTGLSFEGASEIPRLVLTLGRERASVDTGAAMVRTRAGSPGAPVLPEHPAYVLYTSGSTGRPKGVVISHRSAAHRVAWSAGVDLGPGDAFLQKTSFGFDVSVLEIFAPLACGAKTVLPRPGAQADMASLLRLIAEQGVTHTSFPPSTLAALLTDGRLAACRSLRMVITGGESVPGDLVARFHAHSQADLVNRYGPTEATISVTSWTCRRHDSDRRPPIGRPPIGRLLGGAEAVLLDPWDQPVLPGVPGELCLGGVCLARGYQGRPELTAERFVPHPFARRPGERLYRSGDLARFRPDGVLEFVGRVDGQVKIRGFRVEVEEIEAVLGALPGVLQAAVVARPAPSGDLALAAFVVPRAGEACAPAALRDALASRLPGYMVPAVITLLDELPLTPTGKVDRRALAGRELPRTGTPRAGAPDASSAPETATEELLAGIWEQLLSCDQDGLKVGRTDHFFELGGHSLLAAQLASRLRVALSVEIPLRAVFEAPILADLARRVDAARVAGLAPSPPLEPVSRGVNLPLSFSQERMWVLDRLEPGAAYNMPGVVALDGRLDVPTLAAALAAVVRRHEALRTTFPAVHGRPVQWISEPSELQDAELLPLVDLSALPPGQRQDELRRIESCEAGRPFDLAAGPVLRCLLLRLDDRAYRLLAVVHHIAADGWSLEIFLREWTEVYAAAVEGRPARLTRLPLRYADYAVWQRHHLTEQELAARLALWHERLAGAPTLLELPVDRSRSAPGKSQGGSVQVTIPPAQADRLAALARGEVATLFMALLAVFDVLLWRLSGQDCLLVGTPVAGRERVELEGLIGLFVETRVLRADLRRDQTFRTLLAETRALVLVDQDRPAVPFGSLVEALAPREGRGRCPLVQVMLAFRAGQPERLRLPGLEAAIVPLDGGAAKLDLTLDLVRREDGALVGILEYDRDLFDPTTAARFAGHFGMLLEGALADPERGIGSLELLTPAERRQLLDWSAGPDGSKGVSLAEILAQGESSAVAVVGPDGAEITYGELGRRVERLADLLRRYGVGPDAVVAVLADRSLAQVVALLAILQVGSVYLPLDPALPDLRLAFLLEDSRAAVVLAPMAAAGRVPPGGTVLLALDEDPGEPQGPSTAPIDDDHLAYLIYTSGSTGVPKAVGVTRRALADHLRNVVAALGLRPSDRILQFGSPVFDVALEQTLGSFAAGAALALRGPDLWTPRELTSRCAALSLTVIDLPASFWAQWVREHGDAPLPHGLALRLVLAGGEAMPPDALRRWARSSLAGIELVNAYGPTEAVITATMGRSARPASQPHLETAPIGRSLAGRSAFVLGGPPAFELRPCGAPGELWLGGLLARGYLDRPDLTAERFVPDSWSGEPGARLYRTGDRARFRADGQLEHLGRIDGQVKVRGFRIEPGEIEAALRSLPGVREAAVVRPETTGADRLLAYFVADAGAAPDPAALRAALRTRLPEFLIPAACVELPELPRTPAGKIDRRALAAHVSIRNPYPASSDAPATPVEETLAALWAQVLEIDGIGVHDDFFDLGGNSLQATQVLLRIAETFGVDLPVRGFFDHPTITSQALALAEHLSASLEGDQLAGLLAEIG